MECKFCLIDSVELFLKRTSGKQLKLRNIMYIQTVVIVSSAFALMMYMYVPGIDLDIELG